MSHELTAYLSIFNLFKLNEFWPYYQKHVSRWFWIAQLSKAQLYEYSRNFDCESFVESTSPDILALSETNLDGSIDSDNFFGRGYLSLIRKDSSTHAWSRSVCEGKTSFCTGLISRKLCRFLLMFSTGFTSLSVLLLFPVSITFFVFVHWFWFYFI